MLGLSAVVAIAATVAAIFIVFSGVGIVVWVRVRKERHALRVLGLKHGERSRGLPFTENTITELSHAEGTALRAHGFLPYGKPTEWGQLASRESLLRSKNGSESSWPLIDKARSLRHSISRSRSKRLSRSSHKHSRMSSMRTVSEMMPSPPRHTDSKEEIPLSAVEGVLELPAERTPQQTPELHQEEEGFHLGMRPISPAWPFPSQKDRSGLFPVIEDRNSQDMFDPPPRVFEESPQRLRGGSIASQTAGVVPEQPIPPPPPPAVFPQERFSYMRNDSVMRLSSMSLDTTNSSILEDGRNGPRSADTELTSPIFPSTGSFVPFSANDVGVKNGRRSFIAANTSSTSLSNFPARSSSTAGPRRASSVEPLSPRRSMTTASRNPSNASDHFGPRRSESISSNPPQRHASLRSGTPVSMGPFENSIPSNWPSGHPMAYVPHFSQFQQPLMSEEPREYDPFYGGSPRSSGTLMSMGSLGQAPNSLTSASPMPRSSLSQRGPLQSALKSAGSQRKGHRRQNCVRISIHPPMTFAGPKFTPTVEEEPEDFDMMEELDLRESAINCPSKPQPTLSQDAHSSLPLSKRSSSRRARAEPSSLGPLAEEPQSAQNKTLSKNKKKKKEVLGDPSSPLFNKERSLPGICTSLPPSIGGNLTHTPSPEHIPPVWTIPEAPSPNYENSPITNSPRRTGVKGPRSQPNHTQKAARSNSAAPPPRMEPLMGAGSPSGLPLITGTQGSDWRKSTDSLHRTNTDVSDRAYRRLHDSQGPLSGGLGTSVASPTPVHGTRTRNSTVKDRVTIWEDANRSASPPKPSGIHLGLPEYTSPILNKNSIPRALEKNDQSPSPSRVTPLPPTPNSGRRGLATPTKSRGLGCTTTPASLYDGDGFFRE